MDGARHPPPLPQKENKGFESHKIAFIASSPRLADPRDIILQSRDTMIQQTDICKAVQGDTKDMQSGQSSRVLGFSNKSFSLNSRKANGFVGKIASAFTEPLTKRNEGSFKIMTWAEKNQEPPATRADEEFLYQNVSNSGTNYIEYQLKNIINKKDPLKITMQAKQDKNKNSYKDTTRSDREKTDPDSSLMWMTAPAKQIQVHQVKNKTVVKISVNERLDCPDDAYFKPLKQDVNEYAEPFRGAVYANVDLNKKKKNLMIYENTHMPEEVHYLNAPDVEQQLYENQDFTGLKNNQEMESHDDVYENTEFITKTNVFEHVKFSGPGIGEDNGYQTPQSVLRHINKPDSETIKTNTCVIENPSVVEPLEDVESDPESSMVGKEAKGVVTVNGEQGHKRAESITSSGVGVDSEVSDTEEENISCDSLNSNDLYILSVSEDHGYHTPTSDDKVASPVEEEQNTDIIQQVAHAAERIKQMRTENTGMFQARRVTSCDDVYENCIIYDETDTFQNKETEKSEPRATLPQGLLRDIQNVKISAAFPKGEESTEKSHLPKEMFEIFDKPVEKTPKPKTVPEKKRVVINESCYEDVPTKSSRICGLELDPDKFYKFHLYENAAENFSEKLGVQDDETFAGFRDYLCRERPAAITSAKGTIRGVKNRVKAGIATFLQLQENKVRPRHSDSQSLYDIQTHVKVSANLSFPHNLFSILVVLYAIYQPLPAYYDSGYKDASQRWYTCFYSI